MSKLWFAGIFILISGGVTVGSNVRVEVQSMPIDPVQLSFAPANHDLLLVRERQGSVSLWDLSEPGHAVRKLSLFIRARNAVLSPDGKSVIVALGGGEITAWDTEGHQLWQQFTPNHTEIRTLLARPSAILTVDREGARIWKPDGTASHLIEAFDPHATSCELSHDGTVLLGGYSNGDIRVVDVRNPAQSHVFNAGTSEPITALALSSDGTIASGDADGAISLWRVDGTRMPARFHSTGAQVEKLMFSAQGNRLFGFSYEPPTPEDSPTSRITEWSLDGVIQNELEDRETIQSVDFSTSAVRIAVGSEKGIKVLEPSFENWPNALPSPQPHCSSMAFSSKDLLVRGCDDGTLSVWQRVMSNWFWPWPGEFKLRGRPFTLGKRGTFEILFVGDTIVLGLTDGSEPIIEIRNLDGTRRSQIRIGKQQLVDVAISPNGNILAVSNDEGLVQLWNADGTELHRFKADQEGVIVAFGPRQDVIATASQKSGAVQLWTLDGRPLVGPLNGLGELERGLAFSPDGRSLAAGDKTGMVRRWLIDGTPAGEPFQVGKPVGALTFSPDGIYLAIGGDQGEVMLRTLDGTSIADLQQQSPTFIGAISFSRSGDLLATGSIATSDEVNGNTTQVWKITLKDHGRFQALNRLQSGIVKVSPTGDVIASISQEGAVALWNTDGTRRKVLSSGSDNALDIAFSLDGAELASIAKSGTLKVWKTSGLQVHWLSTQSSPGQFADLVFCGRALLWITQNRDLYFSRTDLSNATKLSERVNAVACTHDGGWVSGDQNGTVAVWSSQGVMIGNRIKVSDTYIQQAAVAPDGSISVFVDGKRHMTMRNHNGEVLGPASIDLQFNVRRIALSPDNKSLVLVAEDGTMDIWTLKPLQHLKTTSFGVGIREVGFVADGIWVANGNGQVIFISRNGQNITAQLVINGDSGIVTTPDGWYSGQGTLESSIKIFDLNGNLLSGQQAQTWYSPEKTSMAIGNQQSLLGSLRLRAKQSWSACTIFYNELPGPIRVAFWPTLVYIIVLLLILSIWIFRPVALANWAMSRHSTPDLPPFKVIADTVTLVRWMGRSERALNQWLVLNGPTLLENCFTGKRTVGKRSTYADIGNQTQLDDWLQRAIARRPLTCWIAGPGGCGKSTLAFQLARRIVDSYPKHSILPIVVDGDWSKSLLEYVRNEITLEHLRPTPEMVARLSRSGRIILVVDGLSEKQSTDSAKQIDELAQSADFKYLMVTSRERPSNSKFQELTVGPLDAVSLRALVEAYVTAPQTDSMLQKITALTKGQPLRPLFAILAIEQLKKEHTLPSTFPALVEDYVRQARSLGAHALRDDDFFRAARIVAFGCIKENWAPKHVTSEFLRGQLEAEKIAFMESGVEPKAVNSSTILDQLVRSGLLERSESLAVTYLKFFFDPIAEYLGAMHACLHNLALEIRTSPHFRSDSGFSEALTKVEEVEATRL